MSAWHPYTAHDYLELDAIERWLDALAKAHPEWVTLERIGTSGLGRRIDLVTIALGDRPVEERGALWLDAGTHASEWTGVAALLYSISRWIEALKSGDEALTEWLAEHAILAVPCISPDGYEALYRGGAYLRSTLRAPRHGAPRSGLSPRDMDNDGAVRWMRFKHPAGALVPDEQVALFMRPRRLEDDPERAYFVCAEGDFINWDGVSWVDAPLEHGVDLNRNFPADWQPFSMFGMDSGAYSASEPESRAVLDAFGRHARIAAALTYHTYTGCILTQPCSASCPLPEGDVNLLQHLAGELARDSSYSVYQVYPDFMYRADRPTPGVWSDTMNTVFGVPAFTVEFWNPYAAAGVSVEKPAAFFTKPDAEVVRALIEYASRPEHQPRAWEPFDHPQLGAVEIGGIDYLRTIRNPPPGRLLEECERGHLFAERLRRALPSSRSSLSAEPLGEDRHMVTLEVESLGYLATSGLRHAEAIRASPGCVARLAFGAGVTLDEELSPCRQVEPFGHLAGWGEHLLKGAKHAVYPSLGEDVMRRRLRWIVRGSGEVTIKLEVGRAGSSWLRVEL